jgi:hypothetical protein
MNAATYTFHNQGALNPHTKRSFLVEPRLVGDDMANLQGDINAESMRTFMYGKEGAETVSSTVLLSGDIGNGDQVR